MTTYPPPHFDSLTLDSLTPLRGAGAAVLFNGVFSETTYLGLVSDTVVQFTAETLGTLMTVSAVASGTLAAGMLIRNPTVLLGVKENTTISAQLSGPAGGVGTYIISLAQTVSSTPLQAIATTHGVANSAVMNAAVAAGKPIFVPAGNYYIATAITATRSDVCIVGLGRPRFWAGPSMSSMFLFSGDRITLQGLTFVGHVYNAFGDTPSTDTLARCAATGQTQDTRISGCVFIGANKGYFQGSGLRVWLDDCRAYGNYQYGIAESNGCQQVFITNYHAAYTGTGEGIKFGATNQAQVYDAIFINNFYISNCGRLDPTQANWQEGIDGFAYAVKNMSISNGQFINCGNGGVELKLSSDVVISPGTYREVQFSNIYIEMDTDHGVGITFNRTGAAPATPDLAGKCRVHNVRGKYTGGGTAAVALFVQVTAWTDIDIVNCSCENFHIAVRASGTGSSDATVRNLFVQGCKARGVTNGFFFANGSLENLIVTQCDFSAVSNAVYVQSGTSTITRNRLTSSSGDAIRADAGTHELSDNQVSVTTSLRGWSTTGTPTVSPVNNRRGFATVAPTTAGALGDVFANSVPSTPPALGWICTVAGGSGAATWTARTT